MAPRAPYIFTPALLLCLAWRRGFGYAANRGPSALGSDQESFRRQQLRLVNQPVHLTEQTSHAVWSSDGGGEHPGPRRTPDWDRSTPLARASVSSTPSVAAASHWPGEHDFAGPVPERMRRRSFEQCPTSAGGASGFAGTRAKSKPAVLAESRSRHIQTHRASKPECEDGTLIGDWGSDFQYNQECCKASRFCVGCAEIADGKCKRCDAGYLLRADGSCALCDDLAGWKDRNGKTCTDYETSGNCTAGQAPSIDLPFRGLKPSDACCKCGGGQMTATPWRYKISDQVLVFGADVSAMPSPHTAERYEVSSGCALGQLGLSVDAGGRLSGTLPKYSEGAVGDDVECSDIAAEDEKAGLFSTGKLEVTVKPMSYGPKVVVLRFVNDSTTPTGRASWELKRAAGLENLQEFRIACVPAVPCITVDQDSGTLSYASDGAQECSGGLSMKRFGYTSSQCTLSAMLDDAKVEASFAVMQLRMWAGMAYERRMRARVGLPVVPLTLSQRPPPGYATRRDEDTGDETWFAITDVKDELPVPKAVRPTVLSVSCSGADHIRWSRQTGQVTIKGQRAFVIHPTSGLISGTPEVDLPQQLGLSSLLVTCRVAAGGENYDTVLTATLYVELIDDTCFFQKPISEPVSAIKLNDTAGSCKTQCSKRKDCAAYWKTESDCFVVTSSSEGTEQSPDIIAVRTKCEEGTTCIEVKSDTAAFLEGNFCPRAYYEPDDFAVKALGRIENVFANMAELPSPGPGFIMFSKQALHTRFPGLPKDNSEHFMAVKYAQEKWWFADGDGAPRDFESAETDVLVAGVDSGSVQPELFKGKSELFKDAHRDIMKGYSGGDLDIKASGCDNGANFCINGSWWQPWDLYSEATATLYSRPGFTAGEELWMARGKCPLPGKVGTWVMRRASPEDYLNPETGVTELYGKVVACITEDIETDTLAVGRWTSAVSLPSDDGNTTETEPNSGPPNSDQPAAKDYDVEMKLAEFIDEVKAISSDSSGHTINASLTSHACQQPDALNGLLFGSITDPDLYSLHACECFGRDHKDTEPVTEESRNVVPDTSNEYNSFNPESQLLFEGPYVCEEDAVLPFGQKNEITQEECHGECLGAGESCVFYAYVPQLRYCLLLRKCERLGHTGLDITHLVYGVFHGESKYCRIADPEACWVSHKRRQLLEGSMKAGTCKFQDVISMCDTMQMATSESHGNCKRCEYADITSPAADGRDKVPLPTSFPAGSQIAASCDKSDVGGRLRNNLLMKEKAVLTCVDGTWRGTNGLEGTEHLSCVSCVHVAQHSYVEALTSMYPEIYFLTRRQLQYHFGYSSSGCHAASEATSSPLKSEGSESCIKFHGATLSAGVDCSQSWYLSKRGELLAAGPMSVCLRSTAEGGLEVSATCDSGEDYAERRSWRFTTQHHLVNLYEGKCLSQKKNGPVELVKCIDDESDEKTQAWYFDGGDCRYRMHIQNFATPPVWNFEVTGDTYLGIQEDSGELIDLKNATEGIDDLAFGTCKTSLSASLSLNESGKVMLEQFDLNDASAARLKDKFSHAFAFSVNGSIVSTCCMGGVEGIKSFAQLQKRKVDKEAHLAVLEACDVVAKNDKKQDKFLWLTNTGGYRAAVANGSSSVSGLLYHAPQLYYDIAFRPASGVTISADEQTWSNWSACEESTLRCPTDFVLTGMNYSDSMTEWDDFQCDRFKIQCRRVIGHKTNYETGMWTEPRRGREQELIAQKDEFVIGLKFDGSRKYTRSDGFTFQLQTIKLCKDKSLEVADTKKEIAKLDADIKAAYNNGVTCATDFPMHVDTFSALAISYSSSEHDNLSAAKASSRCHLMHRGHPGSAEGFALSAPQLTSIVRAEVYRAEEAASSGDKPFSYTGAAQGSAASAMKVGYFAMVEHGATLWGLQCRPGSVVAVDDSVGSPYCFYVNAAHGDVVMGAVLPASASCESGYAVGGWYNLGGQEVQQRNSGGPSGPTGFKLTCRAVPGLSRLCEFKEGRCEADEVVAGLAYEKEQQIKYKCCKAPMTVGHVFAHTRLLDMKPWEGYYCPEGFDENGRAIYTMERQLAPAEPDSGSWWPEVHRGTPAADAGDWSLLSLTGHEPQCDPGELMTSWKIHKKRPGEKITVAFSCARLGLSGGSSLLAGLGTTGCQEKKTDSGEEGQDAKLLVDHNVECPNHTALAKWRLAREGGKIRYVFSCCAVHAQGSGLGHEFFSKPERKDAPLGSVMERLSVGCPHAHVIQGFKLEIWKTDYLRYRMQCVGVWTEMHMKGESQRLAWNKFWGTWVLWQIPVVERRIGAKRIETVADTHSLSSAKVGCGTGFALQGFWVDAGESRSKESGDAGVPPHSDSDGHDIMVARCRATHLGTCTDLSTAESDDRTNMKCPDNHVLQRFKVGFTEASEVSFEYVCCEAPNSNFNNKTCQDRETNTKSSSANASSLLAAESKVRCGRGEVLQQMQLQVRGAAEIHWSYRCCAAEGVLHSNGGIRSSSSRPEDAVAGVSSGATRVKVVVSEGSGAKVWLNGELQPAISSPTERSSIDVLALDAASRTYLRDCGEAEEQCHLRSFSPGRLGELAAHLNSLAAGNVVIVSMRGISMGEDSGEAVHALQRCGARKVSASDRSVADRAYALVGVVGWEALAEAFSQSAESSVTLSVDLPDPFTAAPLVGFTGAFINAVQKADIFPKEKPVKPEILSFSSKQPDYDQFCDVQTRLTLKDSESPGKEHPCFHTYDEKVTEQSWWTCIQRVGDRGAVAAIADVQQAQFDAEMANMESIFGWVEMGVSMASTAIAAIPYGSYAVPAEEGAESAVEGTKKGAMATAMGLFKDKFKTMVTDKLDKIKSKFKKKGKSMTGPLSNSLEGPAGAAAATPSKWSQKWSNFKDAVGEADIGGELKSSLPSTVADTSMAFGMDNAMEAGASAGERVKFGEEDSEEFIYDDDGKKIKAIPKLDPPDGDGAAAASNLKKLTEADNADCDPLQLGLTKVMCDLYCTENAVKEGNKAVISNIQNSHSVLMTNIQRLLDHHTKTLMWAMGQLRDSLKGGHKPASLLLWGAGDEQRAAAAGDGGGGPEADASGLSRVGAAVEELRALPGLLEASGTVLEAGSHHRAAGALTRDVADWHNEASQRMLGRLHHVLEHAANGTDGVPGAVRQATTLVRRFASERALRLREPAPEHHEVVQSMTTKKAAALRAQIRGKTESLERVASLSSPLRAATPEVLLDLVDDDVIIRWNQLADHFVAAHEKHAVFTQARARALAAAEDAVRSAEKYVGCEGSQLGDLQDSWQHALRVEDHAADVLLEAWASTVAAQERLQMAVDAGLLKRIAGVAAIRPVDGEGGCGGEVALVAEEAHAAGVRAVDRALWPLLEQVMVLEQIAKYQEDEIHAKKLRGVDRLPVTPTLRALHHLSSQGADPATPAGRALAARALDRLGPAACPAPSGCGAGMLLFEGVGGLAWTLQQPGMLLLQTEGISAALARACGPPEGLCADPNGQQQPESLQQQQQQQQQLQPLPQVPHEPRPQERCGPGCEEKLRLTLSKKRSTIREVVELLR